MKHRNRKGAARRRAERLATSLACVALGVIMAALACYALGWYATRARIREDAERYRAMYDAPSAPMVTLPPSNTPEPTDTALSRGTPQPIDTTRPEDAIQPIDTDQSAVTSSPTATRTPTLSPVSSPVVTSEMVATQSPARGTAQATASTTEATPSPSSFTSPSPTPTAEPELPDIPVAVDELIPTPNPDTLVFALPTAPPVQDSFAELLALNPDTIGFLEIDGMLSLPVVQRKNDNDYYLDHNFDGEEAIEGALFMDGVNRLVPEDDCLIIYGHNMKNNTMFGRLDDFEGLRFMRTHPIIRFDTLYENRLYTPFAAFTASMKTSDKHYFDVRRFLFDQAEFEQFVLSMKSRSIRRLPVDAEYGDHVLLLVTCDYTNRQGRFILALRQLRDGETEEDIRALFDTNLTLK